MYSYQLVKVIDGSTVTLQVVYPGHEVGSEHLANDLKRITEEYNRRLTPSRLLFVCPCGMEESIAQVFNAQRDESEDRLVSTTHISVAPFDEKGLLASNSVVHLKSNNSVWNITDEFLLEAAQDGISGLFDQTQTVMTAPHGYVFRKLSGRELDFFVRAGNMLREPGCTAVFNHMILRKLPLNCSLIYIDSFTILSFAISLQSIIEYFHRLGRPLPLISIESTHSYEISPDFRIPNENNYLVLISASTSGGLAKKLVDEFQAEPTRIIHLLGVGESNAKFRDSCVYFRSFTAMNTQKPSVTTDNAAIEIGTEEFLVAQGPPRPVRITTRHVNQRASKELLGKFYRSALQFGESGLGLPYSPFSISNESMHKSDSPVRKWVSGQLIHELPASVDTLVYLNDPMSECVADWVQDSLQGIDTMSMTDIERSSPNRSSGNGSFVLIAHHDPGLEGLARSAIALRKFGSSYRHYVVCFAFPSSRKSHDRRRDDLRTASGGRKYGWSEFFVLPVGARLLHDSLVASHLGFSTEAVEAHRDELGQDLVAALLGMNASGPIPCDRLFLPCTSGAPIRLRHGSVFFPNCTGDGVSQVAVYAMVSAAIQCAREPTPLSGTAGSPDLRFDSNPFVRSVLDPSMFTRFSDGILQASFLRAARRSELDYSASHDLSRQFTSTCSAILLNYDNPVGDAAIEFVYALASEKVLLRPKDLESLKATIESIPVLHACQILFLNGSPLDVSRSGP